MDEIDKTLEQAKKFLEDNESQESEPDTGRPYHPVDNPNGLFWDKNMDSWRWRVPDKAEY